VATIVLRDIPKERIDLDALTFPVGGGFRGFQNLLPGYHVITVHDQARSFRHELVLAGPGEAEVLIFDGKALVRDDSEEGLRLAELAASGAMNRALVDALAAGPEVALAWHQATGALDRSAISLEPQPRGADSRFVGFWSQHGGDAASALREVQAAFVRLFLDGDFAPLRHLLQAHYHAGDQAIAQAPDYFARFAQSVAGMLALRRDLVAPGSAAVAGAEHLIEDLREQRRPALDQAADALAASLR
jgi:hypothetical protein